MKPLALFLVAAVCGVVSGCSDNTGPQLTETEKKLTAHDWKGVWQFGPAAGGNAFTFPGETLVFETNRNLRVTECDSVQSAAWSVKDSAGNSYLTLTSPAILEGQYIITKLTDDTLKITRITGNMHRFMLVRSFKGYQRVAMIRISENGTLLGQFGLRCAELADTKIPEYGFEAYMHPNPISASGSCTINFSIEQRSTVKITLDDAQNFSKELMQSGELDPGHYSSGIDLADIPGGVGRLTFTVQPSGQPAKTTFAYIAISSY